MPVLHPVLNLIKHRIYKVLGRIVILRIVVENLE